MPQVEIPGDLFQQIQANVPAGGSVDAFVREAVRTKLSDQRLRDVQRPEQSMDDLDALCEEVQVVAPGTHLTRDQLHERN
jgi:hypothetical protein